MRIVVAKKDVVCESAIAVLRDRGHTIDVHAHELAVAAIRARAPEVILVWCPETDGVAMMRDVSAADAGKTAFVVGVLPNDAPDRLISSALAAGCHDVVRTPCSNEELVARVEVLERLRGWQGAKPVATATKLRVDEARAWQFLGDVVADDLELMVAKPLRVVRSEEHTSELQSPA